MKNDSTLERCAICGCRLSRQPSTYARPTLAGRGHATRHHVVPERFFGRSANRPGVQREPIFKTCPWGFERETRLFCYDCHEELLHNPVFLPDDISRLATLVRLRGLGEEAKTRSKVKIGGRIRLLHDVIAAGLATLLRDQAPTQRQGET